jgi:hypothetical protein
MTTNNVPNMITNVPSGRRRITRFRNRLPFTLVATTQYRQRKGFQATTSSTSGRAQVVT